MRKNKQGGFTRQDVELDYGKDNHSVSQYKTVYEYFKRNPATMFQCEVATGIPRPYVCWYIRNMRKREIIQIYRLGRCPVSKWKGVQFLTSDEALFKTKVKEPSIFDEL